MRYARRVATMILLATLAAMASAPHAQGQVQPFGGSNLPSQQLGRGFFGGFTSASQFSSRTGAAPVGPLAAQFSVSPARVGGGYVPSRFDFSRLQSNLTGLRLRTLESFALAKRARFAGLQRMSLDLASMIRSENLAGEVSVGRSFFQFVFPFGLRDKPDTTAYAYWSLGCLTRGLIEDPDAFLAEFTEEAQETISEPAFMKAVAAMVNTGKPPEGRQLDLYYDSQLAAMGNYLFSNRRYHPAADAWAVLARRDPTSSLFAQAHGQTLFAARQFKEASAELRRSLTLARNWGEPTFRIAGANLQGLYAEAGDLAEARLYLSALLKERPTDTSLRFLMAYTNLFHGLWDRAEEGLASLAAEDDRVAETLLEVLRSGRVAESVRRPFGDDATLSARDVARMSTDVLLTKEQRQAIVDSIIEPDSVEDLMTRGDFYFFMGSYTEAAKAYGQAADMEPQNPIAKFAVVHAALASGEFSFAARRLQQALEMEPNWGLYNFRIEEFFGDRKDLNKRITDLEHLVQLDPDNAATRLLLGYVYYFDGQYDQATSMLSDVITAEPTNQAAASLLKLSRLQG